MQLLMGSDVPCKESLKLAWDCLCLDICPHDENSSDDQEASSCSFKLQLLLDSLAADVRCKESLKLVFGIVFVLTYAHMMTTAQMTREPRAAFFNSSCSWTHWPLMCLAERELETLRFCGVACNWPK